MLMTGRVAGQRQKEMSFLLALLGIAVLPIIAPKGKGTREVCAAMICVCLFAACAAGKYDHFLIFPRNPPASVVSWSEDVDRGNLRIHLEWAHPKAGCPCPAVLVHPEAGQPASEMRGMVWDLAAHGYTAVAADYRRLIRGKYRKSLFAWRDPEDQTAAFEIVRTSAFTDKDRIATLGFSQGGVFSLVIAASRPDVRAAVAYYPVTDFEYWMSNPHYGLIKRLAFRFVRSHFKKESGATSEQEFRQVLERASPLKQADKIHAAVLLIHGVKDSSASVEESRRLASRLNELGRTVKLLEIPGAGHVFNFRNAALARDTWDSTLEWLDANVKR